MSDILFDFCEDPAGFRTTFNAIGKNRIGKMLLKCSFYMNGIFAVRIVDPDINDFFGVSTFIQQTAAVRVHFAVFAFGKNAEFPPGRTQFTIERKQFLIGIQPVKTTSAKRIAVSFHRVFVALIDARNSRKRKL